jgi:hypothetical protein
MSLIRRLRNLIRTAAPDAAESPPALETKRAIVREGEDLLREMLAIRVQQSIEPPIHVVAVDVIETCCADHRAVSVRCVDCCRSGVWDGITMALADLDRWSAIEHVARGRASNRAEERRPS